MVVCRCGTGVGKVAAAVAGSQKLAAHTLLPLKQDYPAAFILGGCQCRHHAGGSAPYYYNSFHLLIPDREYREPPARKRVW